MKGNENISGTISNKQALNLERASSEQQKGISVEIQKQAHGKTTMTTMILCNSKPQVLPNRVLLRLAPTYIILCQRILHLPIFATSL